MLPNQLTVDNFASYPPEAKKLVEGRLELLRRLPLAFVPLLLRELIVYDWKFPAERRDFEGQFAWFRSLSPEQMAKEMTAFARLRLSAALENMDWVNSPGIFSEQLTAHLWATHQIDAFTAAAVDYVSKTSAASARDPLPTHRLGMAVIGLGVSDTQYRLFRKLRPQGEYFTQVKPAGGIGALVEAVAQRAAAHPAPYGHWYIDGGVPAPAVPEGVSVVSYAALAAIRAAVQNRMRSVYTAPQFDPEMFRTRMAQTRLEDVGFNSGADGVLNRFQLSVLTEGSGTQVFATTFVQWAAREALRRAQPVTMLARFGPRQRENSMSELLNEASRRTELDPQGSLVDADMGAWYNWLNQQRLPFADQAKFLVWFEDHSEAVAVGPEFGRGKRTDRPIDLRDLIAQVA